MQFRKTKLIMLATFASIMAGCSSGPSSIAGDFYQNVSDGQIEKAVAMIDLKQAEGVGVSEGKLRAALTGQSKKFNAVDCGGLKDVSVTSEEVRGDVAVLKLDLICSSGKKTTAKETLVKVDGKWKITINM